jgi:hypothetical protein
MLAGQSPQNEDDSDLDEKGQNHYYGEPIAG